MEAMEEAVTLPAGSGRLLLGNPVGLEGEYTPCPRAPNRAEELVISYETVVLQEIPLEGENLRPHLEEELLFALEGNGGNDAQSPEGNPRVIEILGIPVKFSRDSVGWDKGERIDGIGEDPM